jgi:hypothetical protein
MQSILTKFFIYYLLLQDSGLATVIATFFAEFVTAVEIISLSVFSKFKIFPLNSAHYIQSINKVKVLHVSYKFIL